MFDQCILPAMTYGAQTWTLTKHNTQIKKNTRINGKSDNRYFLKDRRKTNEYIKQTTKRLQD